MRKTRAFKIVVANQPVPIGIGYQTEDGDVMVALENFPVRKVPGLLWDQASSLFGVVNSRVEWLS